MVNESKYHFLYFLDICETSKTYITQIPNPLRQRVLSTYELKKKKKANSLNAITKKYRNVNTYYNLAQRISQLSIKTKTGQYYTKEQTSFIN